MKKSCFIKVFFEVPLVVFRVLISDPLDEGDIRNRQGLHLVIEELEWGWLVKLVMNLDELLCEALDDQLENAEPMQGLKKFSDTYFCRLFWEKKVPACSQTMSSVIL